MGADTRPCYMAASAQRATPSLAGIAIYGRDAGEDAGEDASAAPAKNVYVAV